MNGLKLLFTLPLALVTLVSVGHAAGPWPEVISARIGFAGHYKAGHWTPIEVTVRGGTAASLAALSVYLPDGDDVQTRYSTRSDRPLQIVPGQETRRTLYAKIGREIGELPVALYLDSGRVIEETLDLGRTEIANTWSVAAGRKLYLTLGPSIGITTDDAETSQHEIASLKDPADLPTQWYGYDGIDAVVIATSRPELFRLLQNESARVAELEKWVEVGGHLVLCVGSSAREVIGDGAPLARFAPGRLVDVETVTSGEKLEQYSGTQKRIPPAGRGESIQLQVPRFEKVEGIVEAAEGPLPLIIRQPRGFGRITFVACDLDTRPLSNWEGRTALVKRLLGEPIKPADETDQQAAVQVNQFGYRDLLTQLRGALDQFPGVKVVPFWIVAVLILGYVALVGPGDYFLVKHVLKRMELTWITFPTIVLVTSLAAYFAATWLKGTQLKLNQVDIVDLDTTSGLVRSGSWANIFSPNTSSYTLSLVPREVADPKAETEVLLSWLGNPGPNYRGMNRPAAGDIFGRRYSVSPTLDRLDRVPIDVWSTKALTATWQTRREARDAGNLKVGVDNMLVGSVRNVWDVPLEGCYLEFDRWAYEIGKLEPATAFELKPGQKRNDLQVLLKEFQQVQTGKFSSPTIQARPYDQADQDIERIVRLMMFHQAAGDKQYTTLNHDQAGWVDLSRHLKLGRAVLMGMPPADHAAAEWQRDGRPLAGHDEQHWTFYRTVLPVDLGDSSRSIPSSGEKRD